VFSLYSFIYGGWTASFGKVAQRFDELFILSLPAFQWFKVPYSAQRPRLGHSCHIVGQRHMLSIGGADPLQDRSYDTTLHGPRRALFATPDPFPQGLGLFDITRLNWTTTYDARAPAYEQSKPVAEYYKLK
jgi:hypothetical protein